MINKYFDQFEALLFDLDGTLIDTMPFHYRAYAEVFAQRGLNLSETNFMSMVGAPAREAIPRFLEVVGVSGAAAEEVAAIHAEKRLVLKRFLAESTPVPLGAAALLQAAHGRKKLALVSSGNREGVTTLLAAMRWNNHFDVVISGDDVSRGKPDPEPYLAAAAALKVAPRNCLVLEDTDVGFASGKAAGMTVFDVAKLAEFE
jgi:HAD superfamily hydrolase (TIGR01509 family)